MLAYFQLKHPIPDDVKQKLQAELEQLPPTSPEEKAEAVKRLLQFSAAHRRLTAETDTLTQQYPDQWIAMDADKGLLATAGTWQDLYQKLENMEHPRRGVAIRQMNTKPRKWLL